jgi:hypothetical protein
MVELAIGAVKRDVNKTNLDRTKSSMFCTISRYILDGLESELILNIFLNEFFAVRQRRLPRCILPVIKLAAACPSVSI